ncbi:prepilin peptidase [Streptococcus dentasini]
MESILIMALGASLGSFIGLIVDRFPEESIIKPRSHCNYCGQTLPIRDLIPIFSQLINRFRCRFCDQNLPLTYSLLEINCALIFWLGWQGELDWSQIFLVFTSLTLSLYDIRNQSYPLIIVLLAGLILLPFYHGNLLFGFFILMGIICQLIPLGIGAGDCYYLALLAISLDLRNLLWIIQMGSLLAIFALLLQKKKGPLAFVPFLSLAYMVEMVLMAIWSPY